MTDLGKTLKSYRTKKYLSIDEVSNITKIKDHYIVALEEEDLLNLPARVYTVGFLKNLADLYDLSSTELILAFDRLKDGYDRNKSEKEFTGTGRNLHYSEAKPIDTEKIRDDALYDNITVLEEDPFSKIRKLSLDSSEKGDDIQSIIEKSRKELNEITLKNEIARELNIDSSDLTDGSINPEIESTFPTSKIMLEFEELMREEERFNTQKLRKMESVRNINKAKNTMRSRRPLGMETNAKNGASMMILVLLVAAILVLLYIIITALLTK